jgi:hypothetical protein
LFNRLRQYKADRLWILGDLTHYKDNHSGVLINRLTQAVLKWQSVCPAIRIVQGNHDYTDPEAPTFGFLNELPGVAYFKQPGVVEDDGVNVMVLPYSRTPVAAWRQTLTRLDDVDLVCIHQPLAGAIGDTGHTIEGQASAKWFGAHATRALVLAGDIHKRQKLGCVHYIGSPYPINYGDDHVPRVVFWDTNTNPDAVQSIEVPTIKKKVCEVATVTDAVGFIRSLAEGDRVKVRLTLPREEFGDWTKHRERVVKEAKKMGVELYGCELLAKPEKQRARLDGKPAPSVDPTVLLGQYGVERGVPEDLIAHGKRFLA